MPGFFEAIAGMKSGGRLLAAWGIDGDAAGARALFRRDGTRYAQVYRDARFPAAFEPSASARAGIIVCSGARLFLEPMAGNRRLVVCGAGHVAQCVVRLGAMLDFEVTAIEDRPEFAEKARAAGAKHVLCKPFGEALDALDGGDLTAFVVMTREHAHDVECLRRILQKPCAYAGMMGSHSRTASIRRRMVEEGFDARKVAALHMPIGLAIGARTPEEIAVSVMAELISVMNGIETGEGFPPGMLEALAHPESAAVLAMIVEKTGEAPRRPGTKMLIWPDGRFIGTAGGGYAEAVVLQTAGEMLREGAQKARLLRISMMSGDMQCGGEIEVLLRPCEARQ